MSLCCFIALFFCRSVAARALLTFGACAYTHMHRYSSTHYTHIYLHDASRDSEILAANMMLGHDGATYIGNTLPRKGLKHWRVPGKTRPLPHA